MEWSQRSTPRRVGGRCRTFANRLKSALEKCRFGAASWTGGSEDDRGRAGGGGSELVTSPYEFAMHGAEPRSQRGEALGPEKWRLAVGDSGLHM